MNSVYSSSVIPASCAVAWTGYSHTTHGTRMDIWRSRNSLFRSRSACRRSSERSAPSRVFSGAEIMMQASQFFQTNVMVGDGTRRTSSGASRANGPLVGSHASCSIG